MSRPPAGANTSRKNANALTTIELAVAPTPKLCANCGSTGRISPKPSAMTNADAMSTQISRGIRTSSATGVTGMAYTIDQYAFRPLRVGWSGGGPGSHPSTQLRHEAWRPQRPKVGRIAGSG
jgi:hypothetical protein